MARYQIWNKTDTIYTYGPPYKFTPEQWMEKYPWAEVDACVISGDGVINGAFCMPLSGMVANASREGCDFSACTTDEEKLNAIMAFEDAKEAEARAKAQEEAEAKAMNEELNATSLASIAASMEYQNMLTLPDEEEI